MNTNTINRVAQALIPAASDEAMAITRARDSHDLALDEITRSQVKFLYAQANPPRDTQALAEYIVAVQDYGEALVWLADAETALHLAMMTPDLVADLQERLEPFEIFER